MHDYNRQRSQWHAEIGQNGGRQHVRGRIWYRGKATVGGKFEEFDEDCSTPIQDLSASSPRSDEDAAYTYNTRDIQEISAILGIPWKESKDTPFGSEVCYIGFTWNLEFRTVAIPLAKRQKYLTAIAEWEASKVHDLQTTQKLYGKLLHASLVIPAGRAFLTKLEASMGTFHDHPFQPRHPPKHTSEDLIWWKEKLNSPVIRHITAPLPIHDINAFSDASSEVGIGIIIGEGWRAWRLLPGWKGDNRDIGWAEAVGFFLLALTLVQTQPNTRGKGFLVYGDNKGVVEGWWRGRSRNWPTNLVFRSITAYCETVGIEVHTSYVRSAENPADGPSRGIYGPPHYLLPAVNIPNALRPYIIDFDSPLTAAERKAVPGNIKAPIPLRKPPREANRSTRPQEDETDSLIEFRDAWQ
jgi:hypothetical protein